MFLNMDYLSCGTETDDQDCGIKSLIGGLQRALGLLDWPDIPSPSRGALSEYQNIVFPYAGFN